MNKIPVLDKGYVGLLSSSMNEKDYVFTRSTFFFGRNDRRLLCTPILHMLIKSPVFVQLSMGPNQISWASARADSEREAYVPSVNDVNAKDLATSEAIQNDIDQTTTALLLNPRSYIMDGCDVSVAQTITPISIYTTYLATASLADWICYINRDDFPAPVKAYCEAIRGILLAEMPSLEDEINGKTEERKGRNNGRVRNRN